MSPTRPLSRVLAVALAMVAFVGVAIVPASARADDAAATGSAVTVKWAGGNAAEIQKYQPDHAGLLSDGAGGDAGSGHWDDFKNLSVTVSKTRGVGDEVVTVTAKGMNGGTQINYPNSPAKNYLQFMQCWGPDPFAADFAQTCQYGAYSSSDGDLKATSTLGDALGTGTNDRDNWIAGAQVTDEQWLAGDTRGYVPFRAVTGQTNKVSKLDDSRRYGYAAFFDVSNSNELPLAYVGADGTARERFQLQSALSQPYLGCGDRQKGVERCWLVAVPRGLHSGAVKDGAACMRFEPAYGKSVSSQQGSPLSTDCSYWQDRLVIPLDFADVRSGCAAGGAETRLVGSELLAGAMSSWQKGLCAAGQSAYSLAVNAPDLSRAQLLQGQTPIAVTGRALAPGTIGTASTELLDAAHLAYAPIANTGLVLAYVARDPLGEYRDLRLTPRLLAKMLTQSYQTDIPQYYARTPQVPYLSQLPQILLDDDPEWTALGNPRMGRNIRARQATPFVVVGPQGDDAIRLLWQYLQSDADAAAFLRGEPDPWGHSVNPSYLQKGAQGVNGAGLDVDLSREPISTFPKADPTVDGTGTGAISSLNYVPYAESFAAVARRVLRTDIRLTNSWDPLAYVSPGVYGKLAEQPAMQVATGGQLAIGPVDAARTADYQLSSMRLALPLRTRTGSDDVVSARTFVAPTDATMSSALGAMTTDTATGTTTLDMSALPADAYPLTLTLFGAVDLARAAKDAPTASKLAILMDYVGGPGNVRGDAPGELPKGYLPLTDAQRVQTAAVAESLRHPPVAGGTATTSGGGTTSPAPAAVSANAIGAAPNTVTTATSVTTSAAAAVTATDASGGAGQAALGGSLLAGLAGVVTAPFLLRRRGAGS